MGPYLHKGGYKASLIPFLVNLLVVTLRQTAGLQRSLLVSLQETWFIWGPVCLVAYIREGFFYTFSLKFQNQC